MWLVYAAMVMAVAPDTVWAYRIYQERTEQDIPMNPLTFVHSRIQWGERTWGWIVEIIWLIGMLSIYAMLARAL